MIYKVCDFNLNGRYRLWSSQPVRLNKVTLDALGIQSAASLCFKHYWQPQENTMVQGPLRKMELTHTHTHALAQRRTCASIAVAWSELFYVCSRDFITEYLSGALCLLDQVDLPTHSHLSEHLSDEITHTGIFAVCFFSFSCMCFDAILS